MNFLIDLSYPKNRETVIRASGRKNFPKSGWCLLDEFGCFSLIGERDLSILSQRPPEDAGSKRERAFQRRLHQLAGDE